MIALRHGRNDVDAFEKVMAITVYDVLQKTEWTDADIEERARWLCEQAKVIWAL